jgi:oligopeptidase A
VLSADAFSAFEEVGLDNQKEVVETGRRFRDTILSLGGGRDPEKVFEVLTHIHPACHMAHCVNRFVLLPNTSVSLSAP